MPIIRATIWTHAWRIIREQAASSSGPASWIPVAQGGSLDVAATLPMRLRALPIPVFLRPQSCSSSSPMTGHGMLAAMHDASSTAPLLGTVSLNAAYPSPSIRAAARRRPESESRGMLPPGGLLSWQANGIITSHPHRLKPQRRWGLGAAGAPSGWRGCTTLVDETRPPPGSSSGSSTAARSGGGSSTMARSGGDDSRGPDNERKFSAGDVGGRRLRSLREVIVGAADAFRGLPAWSKVKSRCSARGMIDGLLATVNSFLTAF